MTNCRQKPPAGPLWIELPKPFHRYEASSLGDVRAKPSARNPTGGRLLKQVRSRNGKGFTVQLLGSTKSHSFYVHRLIGLLFNGFPKKRGHVYWKDGDDKNNSAGNLGFAERKDEIPNITAEGIRPASLDGEEWRPVKGYEGLYEVSSLGRVMRVRPSARSNDYRLMGNKPGRGGYVSVTLTKCGRSKSIHVHRLVADAFIPKTNPKANFVDHKHDPKSDNRVENLRWATHRGNMKHAWQEHKDRQRKGLPPKTKPYCLPVPPKDAIWRPLYEWDVNAAYEVSNYGHVKRVKRAKGCRTGRLLAMRELPSGYIVVKMRVPSRKNGVTKAVHQVVAAAFKLPRAKHHEVIHHRNHNKQDNRPENLEWTTRRENTLAAVAAGQFERDGKHVSAIIGRDEARQMRDLATAMTRHELAETFGVSLSVVDDVLANRTHVDPSCTPVSARSAVAKGESHRKTPLNAEMAIRIVQLRRSGSTYEQIRTKLGNKVSVGTIGNIVNGHTWSETTGIRPQSRGNRDEDWGLSLAACARWCVLHGSLRNVKVEDFIEGFPIGRWIDRRRAERKRGALTKEQISQLDAMGMIWDPQDELMQSNMAACQRYADEHGGLANIRIDTVVTYSDLGIHDFKLGQWIGMQRTRRNTLARKKQKASVRLQRCFDELSRLGVEWNPKRGPKQVGVSLSTPAT